jgi:hypothetical protein
MKSESDQGANALGIKTKLSQVSLRKFAQSLNDPSKNFGSLGELCVEFLPF